MLIKCGPNVRSNTVLQYMYYTHRVGRVLSFFSSRRNWDSPTPRPLASVPSPPLLGGEGHTHWRERGVGESQFRRGDIHCGTLYIYVLCDYTPTCVYSVCVVYECITHAENSHLLIKSVLCASNVLANFYIFLIPGTCTLSTKNLHFSKYWLRRAATLCIVSQIFLKRKWKWFLRRMLRLY